MYDCARGHGWHDRPVGTRGALNILVGQPFGRIGVALVAAGLVGFILRRLVQLVVPARGEPARRVARVLRPIGFLFSAIANVGITLAALQLASQGPVVSSLNRAIAAGWRMRLPTRRFGGSLILCAGLVMIGVAVNHLRVAKTAAFKNELELDNMSAQAQALTFVFGRAAHAALGVALLIVGVAVAYAGFESAHVVFPERLQMAGVRFGAILPVTVAVGFIVNGFFLLFVARYLRLIASW